MSVHRLLWVGCLCCVTALGQASSNLIPNPEFRVDSKGQPNSWQFWSPRPDLEPHANIASGPEGSALRLAAVNFSSFGKWINKDIPVRTGHCYRFEVLYKTTRIVNERGSVGVMLSWNLPNGHAVQRDYVDELSVAEDGWHRATRTLRVPEKATNVTVELWLRWTADGAVSFRNPSLAEAQETPPRKVKVVTTRIPVPRNATLQDNLRSMAEVLDKAGRENPDAILLTEFFPERGVKGTARDRSEPIPGPATDVLSRKAREYNCYVIAGVLELDGGKTYDTAVLIDRAGRIAGKYRKTHLPLAEIEDGETPGNEYPVFETDFGRIGILICWDFVFPETFRIMRLKGAEIVFLPTAGDPGARHWDTITRARALDNGLYLVASVGDGAASRIVNPDGEVIAETTDGLAAAELEVTRQSRLWWLSVGPANGELKSLVIQERRPETYKRVVEGLIR